MTSNSADRGRKRRPWQIFAAPWSPHSSCQVDTRQGYDDRLQLCRFVRYLGGDLSLVDEVCAIRGFQEVLAASWPEDPRHVLGEVVEATGGTVGSATTTQLARACTEAIANAVPGIIERLSAHIDERMAQDRHRISRKSRGVSRVLDDRFQWPNFWILKSVKTRPGNAAGGVLRQRLVCKCRY